MNPREGALLVLHEININDAFSNIALNKELKGDKYNQLDKNLLTELVYGVLENLIRIDYIIGQFSSFDIKKMNSYTLDLLRLGIYQLLFLDKVPAFAAVNETVNLSKQYAKKTTGFINGILRNVERNQNNIKMPNRNKNIVEYLSVVYSHPPRLIEQFLCYFDIEFVEELLKANNTRPELFLRINTLKISVEDCIQLLVQDGCVVEKNPFIDEAITVRGFNNIEETEVYKNGYIQVQDFSSMLVAKILDPKEGELVIDVCSAPGGKTTHMAQLMNNNGKIIARDIHQHKLELIKRNAKRLAINIISTEKFSGEDLDDNLIGKIDKVLVDVPCSGLGIIRRKPEIRYRKLDEDVISLSLLQSMILENASKYAKIGGEIVYSTCTIDPRENEEIIKVFLEKNKNFELVDINEKYKKIIPGEHNGKTIQLYPNVHKTDGFFISKLKRIK